MVRTSQVFFLIATACAMVQAAGDVVYVASDCPIELRYLEDPAFVAKVARENGLSATRFYSQETPTQKKMIAEYAKRNGLCLNPIK